MHTEMVLHKPLVSQQLMQQCCYHVITLTAACVLHLLCFQQSFWSKLWFWREVVDDIPLRPENFRIFHPEIIHKTGQVLQKYTLKQGNVSSNMFFYTQFPFDKL